MYLLLSRKDRPMSDALSGIAAVGLTAGLGYVLLCGTRLGGM
jgi:hypothetical protein